MIALNNEPPDFMLNLRESAKTALARRGRKRIVEQGQPEMNLCLPNAPKLFPPDLID